MSRAVAAVLLLLTCAGCSGSPARVHAPEFDPAAAAAKAIELHDKNGDSRLSQEELADCAGLRVLLARCDANADKALERDEVAAGVQTWVDDRLGMVQVGFRVLLDGQPLPGAEVSLEPEPSLAETIPTAQGTASDAGSGDLQSDPQTLPEQVRQLRVVRPGVYRVRITHPTRKIPARYNTQTELGLEVSQRSPGPAPVTWSLRSK